MAPATDPDWRASAFVSGRAWLAGRFGDWDRVLRRASEAAHQADTWERRRDRREWIREAGEHTANAGEAAQTIEALVPYLPQETANELLRLLVHWLAAPTPAQLRERRIGLLVEIVADETGEVPSTAEYEDRRTLARGSWPHYATLIRAYGHWLKAVEVAMRMHKLGGVARTPSSFAHGGARPGYTRTEACFAIEGFERMFGLMPTEWEFEEWRLLARRLARSAGNPEPRIPGMKQIRKLFGDYARAVETARTRARSTMGY
jgi:hypothetical protein